MSIPIESIHRIHSQKDFLNFLSSELSWPLPEDVTFTDVSYGLQAEDIGLKKEDLRGSTIAQLRPFTEEQPWGIFILQLNQERLYFTELRKILRGLEPMKRTLKDYPTWKPQHVLFICTHDWKNFTFAHVEGEESSKARIATFGWEYQSDFVRTLCEFNIPQLAYPQTLDMFGLDPKPWVKQWSSAFDVTKVTKRFYKEYDAIFKSIKLILADQFGVLPKLYKKEISTWSVKESAADEKLHLFVQNLVNRLMFLKFLEKRRWLDFNPRYLADLYKRALGEGKNFYGEYLFYVFYAGLNRQIQNVKFGDGVIIEKHFEDRIGVLPFLNGGLFEKEPIDDEIKIPNEAFTDLFDLFSRYNFTVNEDTPLDVEVAVNPEMLGKVFEESVISRKEKGAYYTPRTIVSFMCREALKNHLENKCSVEIWSKSGTTETQRHGEKIQEDKNLGAFVPSAEHPSEWQKEDAESKIQKLVDEHDAEGLTAQEALDLYKALYSIKVLDPAVGSGAFPVGMMFELLECYKAIGAKLERDYPQLMQNKLADMREVYKLKRQIIQNNLFGVDQEDFAVNIARLRFWLSLAVDFPIDFATREEFVANVHHIEPLPNLLYKIRQGDSLLAKYHGVSLEMHGLIESGEVAHGRKQRLSTAVGDVTRLKQEFFLQSDSSRKKAEQQEIEGLLKNLVAREIDVEIESLRTETSQHEMFGMTKKQKEEQERAEEEMRRLEGVKKELLACAALPSHFPVMWDVDFGEVMAEGGFDVVIANPPYVRQEEFKEIKPDLALHYECYTGTADLFTYFFERGVKLLKPGGTLSYISSNKYFHVGYGEKLRRYLTGNMTINALIDFGDLPVFEATAYPSVLVARKNFRPLLKKMSLRGVMPTESAERRGNPAECADATFRARTIATEEELDTFEQTFRATAITMKQSDLNPEGWRIEDRSVLALLDKIKCAGISLEEFVEGKIYCGIKTGFNDAFVIDSETRKQLIKEDKKSADVIKPFLRGRDIKRYVIDDPNLWLIYVPWDFDSKNYKSIMKHLESFKKELSTRPEVKERRFPWYALSRYASDYWKEFEKPKIMLQEIAPESSFAWDENKKLYSVNTTYIIADADKSLLGILNSTLVTYYYRYVSATIQGGYMRFTHQYLAQIPIVRGTAHQRQAIEKRVEKILSAKSKNPAADTTALEREIDGIVYEMYGLTKEEILVVEGEKK